MALLINATPAICISALNRRLSLCLIFLCIGVSLISESTYAQDVTEVEGESRGERDALMSSLRALQSRVADRLELRAAALVDVLVYRWTEAPPFENQEDIFLASVTGPIGFGSGLSTYLENHLGGLLIANPSTKLRLTHCPACTSVMIHSTPTETTISRGADQLEGLRALGGPKAGHALYLDLSIEGSVLVLRARLVSLEPGLPIRWGVALSEATLSAPLLRSQRPLQSVEEARRDYLDALRGDGPLQIPLRFAIRSYTGSGSAGIAPPPLLWAQLGAEFALSTARVWIASAVVGFSWLPEAYDGVMLQARAARLLTGRSRSLTRPDLYLFFGGAILRLDGPAIAPFAAQDSVAVRRQLEGSLDASATFGTLQLGLDLRLGQRIGVSMLFEHMPAYTNSESVGEYFDFGLDVHSVGVEVSFCY